MSKPSTISTFVLFGRLALRRLANRCGSMKVQLWKKSAPPVGDVPIRKATQHRSERTSFVRRAFGLWLPIMSLFGMIGLSLNTVFVILGSVQFDETRSAAVLRISPEHYSDLQKANAISDKEQRETAVDQALRSSFSTTGQWLTEAGKTLGKERLEEKGIAAFAPLPEEAHSKGMLGDLSPEGRSKAMRAVGLYLAFFNFALFIAAFGMMSRNLSGTDPAMTFLWQFPVSRRVLFSSKLIEYAFDNPIIPLTSLFYMVALGMIGATVPVVIGVGLLLGFSAGVTSAALRLATEVVMTQRMSRKMRGAIVAFCTTVGGMTMFVAMMGSNSQFLIESFIKGAASLPAWFSWNPFTAGIGTAAMMNQSPLWWLAAPALAATSGVVAVLLAVQLTQRGLACGLDSVRTAHSVAVVSTPARRASFGITAWKEMLQMHRQPEFLGQILVTPIIIGLMMYFTGYKNVMEFAVKGGPNIAVAILVACAYMLMIAATQMLTSELKMLWLLQCQPRPLADVIRSKARVWAVISIGLAVPFILGSIVVMPGAAWSILVRAPFLLVALWLLAELIFSLTALAAIVTNEQTIRFRRSAMLPMLVVSNCSLALYNGSWWLQLGALATTVILNAAVRERALVELRWLSEPVDTPPVQVYPMHAILALIGFQSLQGMIGAALSQRPELSVAASMAIAYIGAALVVSACCWDWMRRNGLIGSLVHPRGPALRPIILGLAFSCAAGFAVTMVLRQLSVDSQLPAYATNGNLLHASYDKWCLLVLWVIAAPLFEEWIVRGMMYRSLRRNWGIALSVAVSAVLFATLHPAAGAIALVTLGSMTALAVERTGRLWPSITIHAGYNFMIWMLCAM